METNAGKKDNRRKWASRLFLAGAAALLVYICALCYPQQVEKIKTFVGGRATQAFSALTSSFQEGDGVVQAFSYSYQVLTGEEN